MCMTKETALQNLRDHEERKARNRNLRFSAEPRARFAYAAALTKLERKDDALFQAARDAGASFAEAMEAAGLGDYV